MIDSLNADGHIQAAQNDVIWEALETCFEQSPFMGIPGSGNKQMTDVAVTRSMVIAYETEDLMTAFIAGALVGQTGCELEVAVAMAERILEDGD